MPAKKKKSLIAKDRYYHIKNINKEIVTRLKESHLPLFLELSRYDDFLDMHFRHNGFVASLIGHANAAHYSEAVYGSIKTEAARLAKDTLDTTGVIYPGVWSYETLYNLAGKFLRVVVATEDMDDGTRVKKFIIIDTVGLEKARNGAPWPQKWTLNDAYKIESSARMAFDEYDPEAFTNIIITLSTAVIERVALTSIESYAPHVMLPKDGNLVNQYAKYVTIHAGNAVNNWVYNECDADDDLKNQIISFGSIIWELVQIAGVLAGASGMDKTLIEAVFAHAGITSQCNYEEFDDIEDASLKIMYVMTYNVPGEDRVVTSTFEITPVHVLRLCCDKKPTATAKRMTGRMIKDLMYAIIRLCISVLADYPNVVTEYILEKAGQAEQDAGIVQEDETDNDPADEGDNTEE